MTQSKKHQLKAISRQCARQRRVLAYTAFTKGNLALLDEYGQLRADIRDTLDDLRRPPSADLRNVSLPVTFQHVDQLRTRLLALQTQCIRPWSQNVELSF